MKLCCSLFSFRSFLTISGNDTSFLFGKSSCLHELLVDFKDSIAALLKLRQFGKIFSPSLLVFKLCLFHHALRQNNYGDKIILSYGVHPAPYLKQVFPSFYKYTKPPLTKSAGISFGKLVCHMLSIEPRKALPQIDLNWNHSHPG